ncbi:hypothetical protein JCM10207_001402 [Rhodosporidiobolus poonsookiae]
MDLTPSKPGEAVLAPVHAAGKHWLPVVHEELGALRRQAFSSAKNEAQELSLSDLSATGAKLKNKVVLITGAGQLEGFGGQYAVKAASFGAKVVVSALHPENVERVVKEIRSQGGQAIGLAGDVSIWEDQVRLFRHAIDTYGQLDVVIANAGMGDDEPLLLDETVTAEGEPAKPGVRCVEVDLIGTLYTAKLAFYHLRRNPSTGVKAFIATGSVSLYAAAKHGILGLMRALHYDGLENGIRRVSSSLRFPPCFQHTVFTIAPWIIATPLVLANPNAGILANVPKGTVEDVVSAMLCASTDSESGKTFFVDEKGVFTLPHKSRASGKHWLLVVREELGALRRQAFSSPKNDAQELALSRLLASGSKLENKVVIITGAGQLTGFGGQYALAAAGFGAKVVVSDMRQEGVDSVVQKIQAHGGQATGAVCDVSNWDDQVRLFRHSVNTYGQVDVVIANAGMGDDAVPLLDETETADGEPAKPALRCMSVDLTGVIYSAKLAFYHLRRSPSIDVKSFVAVGSVCSYFTFPTTPLYAAAKHGVLGLTRALHYDGLENGISVSTIAPWIISTPLLETSPNAAILADVPKGTVGDVVGAMLCASTDSESGKTFFIDEKGAFAVPHKSRAYLEK